MIKKEMLVNEHGYNTPKAASYLAIEALRSSPQRLRVQSLHHASAVPNRVRQSSHKESEEGGKDSKLNQLSKAQFEGCDGR